MKQLGISVERFLRDTDYYTLKRVLDGTTPRVHPNTLTNILDLWLDDNFSPPEAEARKKLLEVSNGAAAPAQAAQFPSDLRTVERLVTRAARYSQDLFVLSDTVDRGSFFDPDRYASIHNKLRAVGSRGKILSYGPIQPITCAAMFHDIGEPDRVKHHAFAAFLDYYFDYLRTDDRDCDYDLPFREWLENHLTIRSDREELLSWLRRYADIAHRDVREGDLSSSIERAIAVVYESGDPPLRTSRMPFGLCSGVERSSSRKCSYLPAWTLDTRVGGSAECDMDRTFRTAPAARGSQRLGCLQLLENASERSSASGMDAVDDNHLRQATPADDDRNTKEHL